MTAHGHDVPQPVLASLGINPTTDALAVIDVANLPRQIPLYEPTLIGPLPDGDAARAAGDVLARSLPRVANVALIGGDGVVEAGVESIADLDGVAVAPGSWISVPAADVRVEAMGAMYSADLLGSDTIDIEPLSRRAAALATGAWRHRDTIDALIDGASDAWRIDRMNAVDRNILRLGAYELRYTDLATGIVVDRAVEIAKRFSTARSQAFVNGVLDSIAKGRGAAPERGAGS